MSVKFVQDVEITSGKLDLSATGQSIIETGGELMIKGSSDGSDNLNIGSSSLDWKAINYHGGGHSFRNNNSELFGVNASGNMSVAGAVTATCFIVDGGTSSQYLMADGSVSTGSSGVSGSGTDGTVPLWNGTGAIDNSCITETTNDLLKISLISIQLLQ